MIAKISKLVNILSAGNWSWVKALCCGTAPGVEHVPVLGQFACRTVVDIGANRGQFALAARRCFPSAKIISFEPLPGPADVFRRVFSDDENIVLYGVAIGPNSETRTMHLSKHDDSSSLLPITPVQTITFPGTEEQGFVVVQVATLQEFVTVEDLKGPAMLKLDVQGFEYEALLGCESLMHCFDVTYCECSFVELYSGQKLAQDLIHWLRTRGFDLVGIYNPHYDGYGRAIQADFLFCRQGDDNATCCHRMRPRRGDGIESLRLSNATEVLGLFQD